MIILSEAKLFMLNTYLYDKKNGLLPFNFGYVAKIENLIKLICPANIH